MFYRSEPWRYNRQCKIWCVLFIFITLLLYASLSFATLDKPYLSFNYDEVAGDAGWGLRGGLPFKTGILQGHIEASFQNTGDILRGKSEMEIGIPIYIFDVALFSNNTVKGYSVAELGRQNDLGLKIRSPEALFGSWDLTAALGIFGRDGGVFADPNALSDLVGLGYNEDDFAGLGLDKYSRSSTKLSIKADSSVNAQLKTTLKHTSGLALEGIFQPELAGAGGNPVHQFGLIATTSLDVWVFNMQVGLEWMFQTFDGDIENERAGFIGWNIVF